MPASKPPTASPPPTGPRLDAVLFDADLDGHRVDLDTFDHGDRVGDEQLLWIDALLDEGDGMPDALRAHGVQARYLRPEMPDGIGVVVVDDWTYLYVDALASLSEHKFASAPLVVAFCPNLVVTAHRKPIEFLGKLLDNEAAHLRIGGLHAGSFAASLLDRMLTDYLDARDAFESAVDRIELLVLRRPQSRHLSELQQLRRQASKLRRYLAMQRDTFDAVARPDFAGERSDRVARHWQLLSARYAKAMTSVESARELVNGSFDVYTSRVSHGINETMRLLTVATVVLGVLAVSAGVLGMNFRAELFDSGSRGFWWAVGGMLAFALAAIAVALGWNTLRRKPSRQASRRQES